MKYAFETIGLTEYEAQVLLAWLEMVDDEPSDAEARAALNRIKKKLRAEVGA